MIKNISELEDYFIGFARQLSSLLHTDAKPRWHPYKDSFGGNNIIYPCAIWIPPAIGIDDKLSNNEQDVASIEIWFLKDVKREDFEARKDAVQLCDEIACDFLSRMKKEYTVSSTQPFRYWDKNKTQRTAIGPIGSNNAYGVALSIVLSYPNILKYDSTKWDSLL